MAIIKINNLVELAATPASGDMTVIVDVSEVADVDKTKKISFANLVTASITAALAAYVPTLILKRQGGSATNWDTAGVTTYTPSAPKIQVGVVDVVIGSGSDDAQTTVTFPTAFSNKPIVFTTLDELSNDVWASATSPNATSSYICVKSVTRSRTVQVKWMAIGT